MENIYIEKYRNEINNFYKKYRDSSAEMETNSRKYQADISESENSKIQSKIDSDRAKALNSIFGIFNEIRTALSIASYPNPSFETYDSRYFDGTTPVYISEEMMKGYVSTYRENFMMLSLIKKYILITNEGKTGTDLKYLDSDHDIALPLDHLYVYKKYAESAISLIESIYNGAGSQLMIDSYADPEFGRELLSIIGDGKYIYDYLHLQNIPEPKKHLFDDVTVQVTTFTNTGDIFANYKHVK